jgi:NRAMP (natural resistance-associated macrophage protein)-like metal ion transporter
VIGTALRFPINLRRRSRLLAYLSLLGPGLIAANAGMDPGGIATYSSIGAKYGYGMLWLLVLITICLAVVQEMSARMGAVTGKGFSDLVRERFGIHWTAFVMLSLFVANAALVVSEFVGMGAAAELFGIPRWPAIAVMAVVVWWLVVKGNYKRVEIIFLLMTLVFFAYPVAAVLAHPDWLEVGRKLVTPSFQTDSEYLLLLVATVGTTISPYMQMFLQSAVADRGASSGDVTRERVDAYTGATFTNVIAASIIIATGATLFIHRIDVSTAEDAAQALSPLAGPFASYLFGIGLFGSAALAASVLPLATTYSVTEALGFERGVSRTFSEAPVFLGLYTGLIVFGAGVAMVPGIDVIRLLIITYVINGVLLPIELITMVRLVNDREVMGQHVNGRVRNVLAYGTVGGVGALSVVYLAITILGRFGLGPGS